MSQREKLIEDLEEALFAVIVNDYMEAEGARLIELNNRLKEDPDADVSKELDARCLRLINKMHRKSRHKKHSRSAYKIVSKVALVACCLMVLFTTAFAVSPTLQEKTVNLIIQTFDISTDFEFHDSGSPDQSAVGSENIGEYIISYIPEEFAQVDSGSDGAFVWNYYTNDYGDTIYIEVVTGSGKFSADTEEAQVIESILINDFEGLFVQKDGVVTFYLADTVNLGYITVKGIGVDRAVLESIVHGISYQEE